MKKVFGSIIAIGLIAILIHFIVSKRSIYHTYKDPTGEYTAILSYKSYLSYIPMPPGSSSDKPGFIKVVNSQGESFGEIPLEMLQLAELNWVENGAEVTLIGEWNFKENYCWHWDKSGSKQIVVKGNPPKI